MLNKKTKKESKKQSTGNLKIKIKSIFIHKFALIAIAFAVLLGVAGYFLLINKARTRASQAQKDLLSAQDEQGTKQIQLSKEELKNQQVSSIKNFRIESLVDMLGNESTKDSLYLVIEAIIQQNDLQIEEMKIDQPMPIQSYLSAEESKDVYNDINIPIVAMGIIAKIKSRQSVLSYEQVTNLMNALYEQQRIFSLKSLKIADIGKQDAGSIELEFDTFMLSTKQVDE